VVRQFRNPDTIFILAFAIIFHRFESCMYTIICMYIANKVEALILYGPVDSRLCYIISDKSEDLRHAITEQLGRGVTLLRGQGAWSGQEKQVILCVVKPIQIGELRRLTRLYLTVAAANRDERAGRRVPRPSYHLSGFAFRFRGHRARVDYIDRARLGKRSYIPSSDGKLVRHRAALILIDAAAERTERRCFFSHHLSLSALSRAASSGSGVTLAE
jgi:hypothetical protein